VGKDYAKMFPGRKKKKRQNPEEIGVIHKLVLEGGRFLLIEGPSGKDGGGEKIPP